MASSITALQQKAQPILGATQAVAQAAPVVTGSQQEELGKLVQSAVTGKAVGPSEGPRASNVQEQQAQQAALLQQEQIQRTAALQDEAQSQQEDEAWLALSDQDFQTREKAIEIKQKFSNELETLLMQFEQGKDTLDLDKQKAVAEQAGFLLRLGSDKYVTKLKTEGAKARLDSDAGFRTAMINAVFQNQQELLTNSLKFRGMLREEARDFERSLADMDIDLALALLSSQLDTQQDMAMYQGLAGAVSAGAEAWGKGAFSSKDTSLTGGGEVREPYAAAQPNTDVNEPIRTGGAPQYGQWRK